MMSASAPPTYAPLELLPVAGLANRLRAMASALCGAEDTGRPLVILWQQQYSLCRGRATALFDLSAVPCKIVEAGFGGPPPYPHRECLSPYDWERCKEKDPYKPIYIKSYGQFHQSDPARWLTALRNIQPHPAIVQRVDSLFAGFEQATGGALVGVHIRRTDHRKAIQLSPSQAFVERMRAYPPATHFFLATDDALEREFFVQAFPGRVHFGATSLNRDSEEGGVQAFVDLLCLASCREILGSAGSSFSEIAAAYGDVPSMLFYLLFDVLKNEVEVKNNVLNLFHGLHLGGIGQCLRQLIQNPNQLILGIIRVKDRLLRHGDLFRVGNSETEIGGGAMYSTGNKAMFANDNQGMNDAFRALQSFILSTRRFMENVKTVYKQKGFIAAGLDATIRVAPTPFTLKVAIY